MATDVNPLDSVVDLLNASYTISNTDGVTPTIAKIYTKPTDKEPTPNTDFIFVYSVLSANSNMALGQTKTAKVRESVNVDIRSKPANSSQANKVNDAHARKVRSEVLRIFYDNIISPDSSFDEIEPNIDVSDLSNGMRGIFRYVLKINLVSYCRDMTA